GDRAADVARARGLRRVPRQRGGNFNRRRSAIALLAGLVLAVVPVVVDVPERLELRAPLRVGGRVGAGPLAAQLLAPRALLLPLRVELAAERLRDLRPLRRDVLELEGIVVERVELLALLLPPHPPPPPPQRRPP